MKPLNTLPSIDWVKRVNRTWLTKGGINNTATAWMKHLAACGNSRVRRRDP